MILVLDTNVYIAAFLNKGLASDILRLGQRKKVQLCVSCEILEELALKLEQKFKIDRPFIDAFLQIVESCASIVTPTEKLQVVKNDPDDNKILECALAASADLIITMDRDLLKLKEYRGTGIAHPKSLTWIIPNLF